jgi:hypothetical protein
MAAVKDKFSMLVSTAELLYSGESFKSTKRIGKIMIFFAKMFESINKC